MRRGSAPSAEARLEQQDVEPLAFQASRFRHHLNTQVSKSLGMDYRSLALFRITLSAVLLSEMLQHAWDVVPFYSDSGFWPRSAMLQYVGGAS